MGMQRSMSAPLYPNVEVALSGQDGNTFVIIARIRQAMKRGGVSSDKIDEFSTEAMSGDYGHVLQTAMRWVSVS